ncbi:uncharacterized protein ASCRUDRAFT_73333 [Ascoidea rubescens DSM 1968]|uniref:Protein BIG1 n=1 Tax=Ascoidea rubescens DSM 1968 TaxID=1344418 RepID=A0A1D2VPG7_9ASCO|nr:hypothetical protein ASCRUDRAFT_73333 [Ascoidea rubescens DSM 1968]ODV63489.1 hypothetical protein ASCRUDRAFT_73333 [Ascoidea rubescens DSM 1968]
MLVNRPFALFFLSTIISFCQASWYIQDPNFDQNTIPVIKPFTEGQDLFIDCSQRAIDNGEHKFDEELNVLYEAFPKCKETGEHLSFKYGLSQDFTCTVALVDELFHLFQLYIHEDVPFSCRLPVSGHKDDKYLVPLIFNFRGQVATSHLEIDNTMNVIIQSPSSFNTIISSTAWSAGTNYSRYIIGDDLPINFSVKWITTSDPTDDLKHKPFFHGFYKLPLSITYNFLKSACLISLLTAIISGLCASALTYSYLSKKTKQVNYQSLHFGDAEATFNKKD